MDDMRTLSEALNDVRKQGFVEDFEPTEAGLKHVESGRVFGPDDVTIVNHERFEGASSAGDSAALYCIETTSGLKGTVVDAYGMYANEHLANFIGRVKVDE